MWGERNLLGMYWFCWFLLLLIVCFVRFMYVCLLQRVSSEHINWTWIWNFYVLSPLVCARQPHNPWWVGNFEDFHVSNMLSPISTLFEFFVDFFSFVFSLNPSLSFPCYLMLMRFILASGSNSMCTRLVFAWNWISSCFFLLFLFTKNFSLFWWLFPPTLCAPRQFRHLERSLMVSEERSDREREGAFLHS